MNYKNKPQAQNLGRSIDDQSINDNVISIKSKTAKLQTIICKSSPITATSSNQILEIAKMLKEQRERRDDAANRLPPMPCGCRDPLRCRCYERRGGRK